MSTAENKLSLVQMIVDSEDRTFIKKMIDYARAIKDQKNADWADDLPEHVLSELKLAIEEADNGNDVGILNDELITKHRKKYPHLKL